MKKIAMIVEDIREELRGAEHYAKLATQYKMDDVDLADAYASMASQELSHVALCTPRSCVSSKSTGQKGISLPLV